MENEKSEQVLSVAFHGSPERLEKLKDILNRLLEEAGDSGQVPGIEVSDGWSQSGGWVREQDGWPQSGGWYLSKDNELVKVSRPDESLEQVTKSVYVAISKAKEIG